MSNTIEILVPTAEPKIKKGSINARVHDLNGKLVGFLWNEKPNGDFLLERLRENLIQKYTLARTAWIEVEAMHSGLESTPEVKKLATVADTVIIAVGD